MITRREFLQALSAVSTIYGTSLPIHSAKAKTKITENYLLGLKPYGNVTLAHITDLHAQLMPLWFREPSVNLGIGDVEGKPPHLTGDDYLNHFNIKAGSPEAYALQSKDFFKLAKQYGQMGGIDRIATVLKYIRAERPENTLFLDGGDTWQGSYTALKTKGSDMVEVMNALKPDAMTGHWEFTLGETRVKEITSELPFAFLGANIFDKEWEEPAFEAVKFFERGGVKVAVIGQAFPYTPIANPRWMIPNWSFGIREEEIKKQVANAREKGAKLVVLLSHNGFDVDRKLASRVKGIDVILCGHTHDAMPKPLKVGNTLLIASGSNGKFISRLDLDVGTQGVKGYNFRLIPIFSDILTPDRDMTALVKKIRAPYEKELNRTIGQTENLLYRRGNFNGTMDDLICNALLEERDAEIALSPGFRWGPTLLPGQKITVEDIYNVCAITYPAAYRTNMTGKQLKDIFEDVADNLFNPDPYYQQGGDMVRIGGLKLTINPTKKIGERITNMTHLKTKQPIDLNKDYVVTGWASVNKETKGPPIWDVIEKYLSNHTPVRVKTNDNIKILNDT